MEKSVVSPIDVLALFWLTTSKFQVFFPNFSLFCIEKLGKKIQKHKSVIIICSLLSPTNKNIVALLSSLHDPIRENNPNNSNFHFISLLYIFSSTKQKQNHTKIHKKKSESSRTLWFSCSGRAAETRESIVEAIWIGVQNEKIKIKISCEWFNEMKNQKNDPCVLRRIMIPVVSSRIFWIRSWIEKLT